MSDISCQIHLTIRIDNQNFLFFLLYVFFCVELSTICSPVKEYNCFIDGGFFASGSIVKVSMFYIILIIMIVKII